MLVMVMVMVIVLVEGAFNWRGGVGIWHCDEHLHSTLPVFIW